MAQRTYVLVWVVCILRLLFTARLHAKFVLVVSVFVSIGLLFASEFGGDAVLFKPIALEGLNPWSVHIVLAIFYLLSNKFPSWFPFCFFFFSEMKQLGHPSIVAGTWKKLIVCC